MSVTLLMAITVNGYIAGLDDDTDWVKDYESLKKEIAEVGVVLYGKRTYDECVKYDAFPYADSVNVVMTHDKKLIDSSSEKIIFTDKSPSQVLQLIESKGFKKVLLIGGGHVNGSFIKEGLVDELIVDIHPVIKANGIRLFESEFSDSKLELVKMEEINDQILRVEYKIK